MHHYLPQVKYCRDHVRINLKIFLYKIVDAIWKLPLAANFGFVDIDIIAFPSENHFNVEENICNGQFELNSVYNHNRLWFVLQQVAFLKCHFDQFQKPQGLLKSSNSFTHHLQLLQLCGINNNLGLYVGCKFGSNSFRQMYYISICSSLNIFLGTYTVHEKLFLVCTSRKFIM